MRVRAAMVLALTFVATGGSAVWAQEPGRVGLVAAAPESVGLSFRLTDRVALRADLVQLQSFEDPPIPVGGGVSNTTVESHEVAVGISALFYIARWDEVRAYVSPRVEYRRRTVEPSSADGSPARGATRSSYGAVGSAGAEDSAGRHFGAFGEIGMGHTRATDEAWAGESRVKTDSDTVRTRSCVGVILRF